ncbi:MAG: cell division protein FtsQ/DivIB [Oligosphaeraceae bacterium]
MATSPKSPRSAAAPHQGWSLLTRISLYLGSLLLGVVAFAFLCGYGARSCYRENPAFLLTRLEMPDNASEELQEEIRRAVEYCGIKLESSYLPTLPLRQLRETLRENPQVSEVHLRRIFPDTLRIDAFPRIPVAILRFHPSTGKADLLVDREGMVLPRKVATMPVKNLPTIRGIKNPQEFQPGKRCQDKGVLAVLTFLKESQLRPEGTMYEIQNVSLDVPNNRMTLNLEASGVFRPGARLVMPLDNVPQEMDRVKIVVDLRTSAHETISYLNAVYENIPVYP